MAWIEEQADGQVFVVWRDGTGRRGRKRKRKVRSRAFAEEVLVALQAREERAQDARGFWDGRGGPCLVAELAEAWVDTYGGLRAERTRKDADPGRVKRIVSAFGSLDVRGLTDAGVSRFAAEMVENGLSGWTAAGTVSTLRAMVNRAARNKVVPRSELPEIGWHSIIIASQEATREGHDRRDAWSPEEVERMLEVAEGSLIHAPLVASLHTGMRLSEMLALRWDAVDFDRKRIDVRTSKRRGEGTKGTKSRRARFTPMNSTLKSCLLGQRDLQRQRILRGDSVTEEVFTTRTGVAWNQRNFSRLWRRRVQSRLLGVGVRPLKWHCTRHTFITRLIERGVPIGQIAQWVGATVAVLESHYAHVSDTNGATTEVLVSAQDLASQRVRIAGDDGRLLPLRSSRLLRPVEDGVDGHQ